jgi:hypothetical protein
MIQAVRRGMNVSHQKFVMRPVSLDQVNWQQAAGISARNCAATTGISVRPPRPAKQACRMVAIALLCLPFMPQV